MKLFIDADGCPVVDEAVAVAKKFQVECIILCDTSHVYELTGVQTITVSKGADSVDYALVNRVLPGDVIVTQDYGLAAMCLAKRGVPVSQDGMVYSDANIGSLLQARYTAKKIRMSGGRLRGPAKRSKEQDEAFVVSLTKILSGASV